MKMLSSLGLVVFVVLISFPVTSDAFSRRSHHSEVAPQSAPLNMSPVNTNQTLTQDVSAQAVPEPAALLLMTIGFGLLAVGAMVMRFCRADSPQRR